MNSGDPRYQALQRRLTGSENRIAWRASDVSAIAMKLGIPGFAAEAIEPVRYAGTTVVARAVQDDGSPTYTFTISTAAVDRMSDTIALAGWKLSAYRSNPVVLWGHDSTLVPVGRAIKVWIQNARLKAEMKFAPADASPLAEKVRKLVDGGHLSATSVGFRPLKYAFSEDAGRKYGIDFLEQELLEFSIVTVPANPECLIDGYSPAKAAKEVDRARRQRELDLMRARS